MEAIIQHINIYNDGAIEMVVICNSCKKQNFHTISHASTKTNKKISIDFLKLGKRCCEPNMSKKGQMNICDAEYNLYNPQ